MALVFVPAQLRDLTQGQARCEVYATTVAEAVAALEARFPGVRERLCRDNELMPGLQVSIDHVMSGRGMRAKLGPTSELHFLPAIGGG